VDVWSEVYGWIIVLFPLLSWALMSMISYFFRPFSFTRGYSFKSSDAYYVYKHLEPGHRRSRAIFSLIYPFPIVTIIFLFELFMVLTLVFHWLLSSVSFMCYTVLSIIVLFPLTFLEKRFFRWLIEAGYLTMDSTYSSTHVVTAVELANNW